MIIIESSADGEQDVWIWFKLERQDDHLLIRKRFLCFSLNRRSIAIHSMSAYTVRMKTVIDGSDDRTSGLRSAAFVVTNDELIQITSYRLNYLSAKRAAGAALRRHKITLDFEV